MKKFFLLLTPLLITSCGSSSDVKSNARAIAAIPQYGNHCGLNRPANGEMPSPTDEVDAACRNHDMCYTEKKSFDVSCDADLITELKSISPKTEPERVARKLIILYYKNSPQKNLMSIDFDDMEKKVQKKVPGHFTQTTKKIKRDQVNHQTYGKSYIR